jgi:chemotaxis protein CheD
VTAAVRIPVPRDRIVGMAEMVVSAESHDRLVTYALGSCLGIAVHDPVAGVAGLLHVMLPQSGIAEERARATPAMFVDTGVPALFRACYELGARKERMSVTVAGGARAAQGEDDDHFQIGKRNVLMLRKLLWRNNVIITAEDVGGRASRTMWLHVGSGEVWLRAGGEERRL